MGIKELYELPNVILHQFPTFVWDVDKQKVILNGEEQSNNTVLYHMLTDGFKSLEEIEHKIKSADKIVIYINSIKPYPLKDIDYIMRYAIIKETK